MIAQTDLARKRRLLGWTLTGVFLLALFMGAGPWATLHADIAGNQQLAAAG